MRIRRVPWFCKPTFRRLISPPVVCSRLTRLPLRRKSGKITVNRAPRNIPDNDLAFPKTNHNTIKVQVNFNMAGRTFVDAPDLAGPVLNGSGMLANSALRFTMIVAKDKKKDGNSANVGSPFPMGNGQSCTVFDGVTAASTLNAMSSPSVILDLGKPSLFSNAGTGKNDDYKILVSITACVSNGTSPNIFFTQSHDPEMEIGM